MKQKTPLAELREKVIYYKKEHFKNSRNDETKNIVDAILAVILSDCNELLPKEKEVIEKAYVDGCLENIDLTQPIDYEKYFKETFSQK